MDSWLQRFSQCVLMILICASLSSGADLKSAKHAYERKDYTVAVKEFMPMAEQGNAEAQLYLGKMYMQGQGILKDPDQAVKWFKASAEQGNADAQFFLGSYYLLPHLNVAEGVKWLRLSAEQSHQDAQLLLGKSYLQGGDKDLPRDPVQAEMWLRLAAKNNLDFYQNELHTAEGQMTPAEVSAGKALAAAWKPKAATASATGTGTSRVEKN
jgi:TPR repeat protein